MILSNPRRVSLDRPRADNLRYPENEFATGSLPGAKPADNVMLIPWYTGERSRLTDITFECYTAVGGCTVRLGVYSVKDWKRNFVPDRLIGASGNVVLGVNPGIVTVSLLTTLRLRRRAYYFLAVYQSLALQFRCATGMQNRLHWPLPQSGLNAGNLSHIGVIGLGGLPDPFPAVVAGNYWNSEAPLLCGAAI